MSSATELIRLPTRRSTPYLSRLDDLRLGGVEALPRVQELVLVLVSQTASSHVAPPPRTLPRLGPCDALGSDLVEGLQRILGRTRTYRRPPHAVEDGLLVRSVPPHRLHPRANRRLALQALAAGQLVPSSGGVGIVA